MPIKERYQGHSRQEREFKWVIKIYTHFKNKMIYYQEYGL
ncbi:MAG: hypothetical protein K0R76_1032 [Alphaproteobacteria bacterium]|jgi:hypothetical protein|nr:hypothetical protein [Alphaproteobacteria bacterium]MDF3034078.1 hypothetical protein [Alphaproteobacteria bacterium]